MNHNWIVAEKNKADEYPVDYRVANFGVDSDVKHTLAHA